MTLNGKCAECQGPKGGAGLCHVACDRDGLRARCVGRWYADKQFWMKQYAGIFTNGMKNKWDHLVYLELFAGPGRCRVKPTGKFDDGSPLVALGLGFTDYFFSDLSPEVTVALGARVQKVARPDQRLLSSPAMRICSQASSTRVSATSAVAPWHSRS